MTESEMTELFITVKSIEREVNELKQTIKGEYQTKEGAISIVDKINENSKDIKELQSNILKAVWIVLSAVITAVVALVVNK